MKRCLLLKKLRATLLILLNENIMIKCGEEIGDCPIEEQNDNSYSLLNWYRTLCKFTKILEGPPKFINSNKNNNVLWFKRYAEGLGKYVYIALNFSDKPVSIVPNLIPLLRSYKKNNNILNPYESFIGYKIKN